jgi:hypothetical protein
VPRRSLAMHDRVCARVAFIVRRAAVISSPSRFPSRPASARNRARAAARSAG